MQTIVYLVSALFLAQAVPVDPPQVVNPKPRVTTSEQAVNRMAGLVHFTQLCSDVVAFDPNKVQAEFKKILPLIDDEDKPKVKEKLAELSVAINKYAEDHHLSHVELCIVSGMAFEANGVDIFPENGVDKDPDPAPDDRWR